MTPSGINDTSGHNPGPRTSNMVIMRPSDLCQGQRVRFALSGQSPSHLVPLWCQRVR